MNLVIFSEVITSDPGYHAYRSSEVGFNIPPGCYDVKFDRCENFESGDFYAPPPRERCSRRLSFTTELAEALETIVKLHCDIYCARAYFAVAETLKLKRFYDRMLQQPRHHVAYKIITDLGEGGSGYALKTQYFSH